MSAPTIRAMRAEDRASVVHLIRELNAYEDAITGNRATDLPTALVCLEDNDRRIAATDGFQLVAEIDGDVVGYVCGVLDTAPPYVRADQRAFLVVAELVVAERVRRQGIATTLIAAAEEQARVRGLRQVLIGHVVGNDTAERLYARLGYRPYALERLKTLG